MKIHHIVLAASFIWVLGSCTSRDSLFIKINSSQSGIHLNNQITENDSINPLDLDFMYNGGGVAVGDFNHDSLPDLYFTTSTTQNRLYLNKGDLHFSDVTEESGTNGASMWCNGATVIDINNDGWDDIYVSTTIHRDASRRRNLLYVNQGLNKNGVPVFRELAREYNLDDTSYSVQSAFFDFDNDGDLDMYLLTTKITQRDVVTFQGNNRADSSVLSADKLFRNDWNDSLGHPVFTDISKQAGLIHEGYGLGLAITDINNDGWSDVYVSNDFFGSDHLYVNDQHGGFVNRLNESVKHTSQNAMGNDIADINNDGLPDILCVDMNPADNFRKKKNMNPNNYYLYQNMAYYMLRGTYTMQYVRNTLQLNQGVVHPDSSQPVFSEIGFLAGIAETDWSWTPSIADFDNDGFKDIIITNGYPRDVTDHDFAAFREKAATPVPKKTLIDQIPQVKLSNYAFRNNGDLQFEDVSEKWGLRTPAYSYGAVYVDLDRDGDLDYVINNINDKAFLYKNTTNDAGKRKQNFVQVMLQGPKENNKAIGAKITLYTPAGIQMLENNPCRGYLSSSGQVHHFGLGSTSSIDSVIIDWRMGKRSTITHVPVNQLITATIEDAVAGHIHQPVITPLFNDVTDTCGITYKHAESDYIDFDVQRLLPHKLSQYGPPIAKGDLDGNGLDDIVLGGSVYFPAQLFMQQPDGRFLAKPLAQTTSLERENTGVLVFDANGDGHADIYFTNGSNEFTAGSTQYQDQLFIGDGKGNFRSDPASIPENHTSKSCVRAIDYDGDGDADLFIGGRMLPGQYPMPVSSFIYRNDSKKDSVVFTDVTSTVAPMLNNMGMICDALTSDMDNDGWPDLILAGDWMPIRLLRNNHGIFTDITDSSGLANDMGWWNSIVAADFDNDGDTDFIAGNLGKNSFYRASHEYPVRMYIKDFDKNGRPDAIPTLYLPAQDGRRKEFPAQTRDDVVDQLPHLKKRFLSYKEFGQAGFHDIFNDSALKEAVVVKATVFESSYFENLGKGKYKRHALPVQAQLAPLNQMVTGDFNGDGHTDIAAVGNDFGTEVNNGRYNALNGLILAGDGKGHFTAQTILQSGFYVPGDGKGLVKLKGAGNHTLLAATQNRGSLKVFRMNKGQR